MRRFVLALALVVAIVPTASAQQTGKSRPQAKPASTVVTARATGELTALTLKRITVGRLSCALGAAPVPRLDRFVLTDPVTIACKGGKLQSIRYAPIAPSTSAQVPLRPSTPTTSSGGGSNSVSTSSGSVSMSAVGQLSFSTAPSTSQSARGPVVALDAQGITVGDVTCPLGLGVFNVLSQNVHVGDVVSLSCTTRTGGPNTMYLLWGWALKTPGS